RTSTPAALCARARPAGGGGALLCRVIVAVVDCSNALDRSALVVEHRLDHVRRNSDPGHAAGGRSTQIVELPWRNRNANRLVKLRFRPRPAGNRRLASSGENIF